jgi:hypothetical protein
MGGDKKAKGAPKATAPAPKKFMGNMNQFGHVTAFGRTTTRPGWYSRDGLGGGKKELFNWDANDCGYPRYKTKVHGGYPYIHPSKDYSLYETNTANIVERQQINELAVNAGPRHAYHVSSRRSRNEMIETKRLSQNCEAHKIIYGNAQTIAKPVLYSTGATHDQMLVADAKVCPRPYATDEQGYALSRKAPEPYDRYDQTTYMPYARTRSKNAPQPEIPGARADTALGVMMSHRANGGRPSHSSTGRPSVSAAGRPSGALQSSNPITGRGADASPFYWTQPQQGPAPMSQSASNIFDSRRPHH